MAIHSYERAIRADMRAYFPGINAITLRLTRGTPDEIGALPAHSDQERYHDWIT